MCFFLLLIGDYRTLNAHPRNHEESGYGIGNAQELRTLATELDANTDDTTMGMCVGEKLQRFKLRVSGWPLSP